MTALCERHHRFREQPEQEDDQQPKNQTDN